MEPRTNVTADPRRAVDSAGTTAGQPLPTAPPPASRKGARVANGPWLRLYAEILDNPKIQLLPDKHFRWWVNLICLAKLGDGKLPDLKATAWRLRRSEKETTEAIAALVEAGLLDNLDGSVTPHDWSEHQYTSDSSAERVKRYREKQRNVSGNVTPGVTVTVQSRAEQIQSRNRAEQSGATAPELAFERLWERHPKRVRRHPAEQALTGLLSPLPPENQSALLAEIEAGHVWQFAPPPTDTRFVPSLDRWLLDRRWTDERADKPQARQETASERLARELREAEDAETDRLIAEGRAK